MKNTKGLSAVITTLIIILLVLVAVGIVWVVVRNVIDEGTEQISLSSRCLAIDLSAESVVAFAGEDGNYTVILKRSAGGEAIGGVKISLFNSTDNGGIQNFVATLEELGTASQKVEGVTGANNMEYTPFFTDSSGNEQLCSNTGEFSF